MWRLRVRSRGGACGNRRTAQPQGLRRGGKRMARLKPRKTARGQDMTVGIDMGQAENGRAGSLDLEELLATRLLVQGNSGSGKSHLLRRLLEQSAPWVQQCVVDPEGDFVTLGERYGHVVIDAARTEAELTSIALRLRQ